MAALDAWVSGPTRGVRRWGTIGQTLTTRRTCVRANTTCRCNRSWIRVSVYCMSRVARAVSAVGRRAWQRGEPLSKQEMSRVAYESDRLWRVVVY